MTDRYLELSANPTVRQTVRRLGLPLPLPTPLRRLDSPLQARPLLGKTVAVGGVARREVADALLRAGAELDASALADTSEYEEAAEAFARPLASASEGHDVLIFDASAMESASDLRALYEFFQPRVRGLRKHGRVLVIGPPEQTTNAMVNGGLVGFTKSLAKEVGRSASTANVIFPAKQSGRHIEGAIRYFCSERSAFVTGQPLVIGTSKTDAKVDFERALTGQTAVVTGAARGIGAACARVLAREGARVFCVDRPDANGLAKLADEIGGEVLGLDVTDPAAAKTLAEATGGIDLLVHNAGVTRDKTLAKMDDEKWDLVLAINLEAIVRITEELLSEKALNMGGRVVAMSSVSGIAGNPGQTNYAASKGALAGWIDQASSSLGRRRVTLNGIAPGLIETPMTAAMPAPVREGARRLAALGQGGQPEDVAEAVLFFCGPGGAAVSSQLLRVCGGALVGA